MDSRTRILSIHELFATQANHWAIFPALIFFMETSDISGFIILGWFLLSFLPVFTFIARDILESFLMQVLLLPIFVGILIVLPMEPLNVKVAMILLGVLYTVLSLWKSSKNDKGLSFALPPFVPLGINLVLSFIAVYSVHVHFSFMMHFSAIVSVIMSLLVYYVDRYHVFTVSNENTSSNMPKSKIFRSGIALCVSYFGAASMIMLFIASLSISDNFIKKILGDNWLKRILKALLFFLPEMPTRGVSDGPVMDNTYQYRQLEQSKPSIVWTILEIIVGAVVGVVLISVVVSFMIFLFKLLFLNNKKKTLHEFEEETEVIDLHESIKSKAPIVREEEDPQTLNFTLKIRRLFRKKALSSHKDPEELFRTTAREFALEEENPDLASIYEKARYSPKSCTKEDLKMMQMACRRKKKE